MKFFLIILICSILIGCSGESSSLTLIMKEPTLEPTLQPEIEVIQSNNFTVSISSSFLPLENFCLPEDVTNYEECKFAVSTGTSNFEHQIQIVSSDDGYPVRLGNKSIRFEVRPGECAGNSDENAVAYENQPDNDCLRKNGKSERAELFWDERWGDDEYWYSWSIFVPEDFNLLEPSSLKMFQFHSTFKNSDGVPRYPQKFHFEAKDGAYTAVNNIWKRESIAIEKNKFIGKWNDMIVNVNWSHENDGFYKVWSNGELKYDFKGPTLWQKGDESYMKFGVYRNWLERLWALGKDGGITVVYYDEIRIGKNRNEVEIK